MCYFYSFKKKLSLFLILSLLIAICGLDHAFCGVDVLGFFEIIHSSAHIHQNHRCCASDAEHSQHARHYNCCDREDPHDHPEQTPVKNPSPLYDICILTPSLFQYCINSNDWLNLKIEKVSQRQEETYELLLCNDTVVLTI